MRDRRRFFALLSAAAWISLSALFVMFAEHERNLENASPFRSIEPTFWSSFPDPWFTLFCLSLPAVLFAGVLWWWFGRAQRPSAENTTGHLSAGTASEIVPERTKSTLGNSPSRVVLEQ